MHELLEYYLWGYMFVWVWICHGICIEVGAQPWVLALLLCVVSRVMNF